MHCYDSSGGAGIDPNADLIGIGVRISVYTQVVLPSLRQIFVLLAPGERKRPSERVLKSGLLSSAAILATGYAVVFSAIIQAKTTHLSVYHALLTLNLNWLICLASTDLFYFFGNIIPCEPSTSESAEGGKSLKKMQRTCFFVLLAAGLHLTLMAAFGVWLFNNLDGFDRTTPSPTSTTCLSMFGVDFPVSSPKFKHAWLAIYYIFLCPVLNIIVLNTFLLVFWYLAVHIWWHGFRILFFTWRIRHPSLAENSNSSSGNLQSWTKLSQKINRPNSIMVFTLAKMLFILSTEFTMRHNAVRSGEWDWSFGQTLSLFLTVPAVWKFSWDMVDMYQQRKTLASLVPTGPATAITLVGRPPARPRPTAKIVRINGRGSQV